MTAPYMRGLLDDDESLLPSAGLLGAAAGGIPNVLAQMALQRGPVAPSGPAPTPQVQRGSPAAPMAPPPRPGPIMDPTKAGLLAGGIAALEANPGSAMTGPGPVLAAALKAGYSSYIAGKQQEQQASAADEQDRRFQEMLRDPAVQQKLGPAGTKFARAMTAANGIAYVQKVMEREPKTAALKAGEKLVDATSGEKIAEGAAEIVTVDGVAYERQPDGTLVPKTTKSLNTDPSKDFLEAVDVLGLRAKLTDFSFTPEELTRIRQYLEQQAKAKGTNVSQSVSTNAVDRSLGDIVGPILKGDREAAASYAIALPRIRGALKMVRAGIKTGTMANARLTIARALNTIGATNDDTVRNTEQYLSQVAELVLPALQVLRPASDKDVVFLMQARGGNISWDAASLERLLRIQEEAASFGIRQHNARAKKVAEGRDPAIAEALTVQEPEPDPEEAEVVGDDGVKYRVQRDAQGNVIAVWSNGRWVTRKAQP